MNRNIWKLVMICVAGCLNLQILNAQVSPTVPKAQAVRIAEGPEVERADADFAIIRWTTNNPGGTPVHYGVVRYGTSPAELQQSAKSPIRINHGHAATIFRVRMNGLKPGTAYYYTVESTESSGVSDGPKSAVRRFTTAGG